MKAISASIVILTASALLLGASFIAHSDTQLFVQIVACVVGTAGLWGWIVSMKEKNKATT